ncbi:MAG TPA: ATP-binding protein [Acetobacteraceae bacterium]|nr:ATP-binding protein [Acetobacteraceae bacterium]
MPAPATARVSLPSEAAQIGRLLGFAEDFAARCEIAPGDRAWLLIILEELFVNAIDHGYGGCASGRIDVALRQRGDRTRIHFSDDAPAFDPLGRQSPDLDLPASERPIGGLGLHLLHSGVDRASYRRHAGRNHVVLVRRARY